VNGEATTAVEEAEFVDGGGMNFAATREGSANAQPSDSGGGGNEEEEVVEGASTLCSVDDCVMDIFGGVTTIVDDCELEFSNEGSGATCEVVSLG
jgi:hypothetical protein